MKEETNFSIPLSTKLKKEESGNQYEETQIQNLIELNMTNQNLYK